MGEQAIQHCRSYAYEAERKLGEMLKATERNKGAKGIGKSVVPKENPTPTLASLGITKKESSKAQKLASLPIASFEAVRDGKMPVKRAERKLGEMLKATERNDGGDPVPHRNRVDEPPTLASLGRVSFIGTLAEPMTFDPTKGGTENQSSPMVL